MNENDNISTIEHLKKDRITNQQQCYVYLSINYDLYLNYL